MKLFDLSLKIDKFHIKKINAIELFLVLDDSSPGYLHKCPYTSVNITNAYVKSGSMMSIFPTGDYRLDFSYEFMKGKWAATIVLHFSVNSPIKDTFG
ncbi:CLUMA_CG006056, isoform A [Clunio marinus]|uniref:CLUMA_CG006056, isoform A n=1 Tax=Clunio marinus TaxID=568069 RepID=A0A1J1I281_9DIPT|nr:CLUMA_CG006056, isoform A [Clunio marinus]